MRPTELELLKSKSLAGVVRDELERLILDGGYEPGERLSEQKIADQLGVSRGPVREAFRALVAEGLLLSVRNKGVAVRRLDATEIADLYELRATLEGKIAQKAAFARNPLLLDALDAVVAEMDACARAEDAEAFFGCNERFHALIFGACDNRALVAACRSAMAELRLARRRNFFQYGSMARSAANHRRLAAKMRSATPAAVRRAFENHVLAGKRQLLAGVAEAPDQEPRSAQPGANTRA